MSTIQIYKPYGVVTFHTETGDLVARIRQETGLDMDQDIVSVQTSRDILTDCPTFSITLTRHKQWHQLVGANDRVSIEMCRPPDVLQPVFIGLVEDVRAHTSISSNGSPSRVVTITGRGVGKAFITFDLAPVPEADFIVPEMGWVMEHVTLAGMTGPEIIQSMWDKLAKIYINYQFADSKKLFDFVRTDLTCRPNIKLQNPITLMNWQYSMWAFFKEVADEPFNEIMWEISGNEKLPTLIMRPTPFNKEDWEKLPVTNLTDEDIVDSELGRSDLETYTLFSVGMKVSLLDFDPFHTTGLKPYWNEEYAKKYGVRRLTVPSLFAIFAEDSEQGTVEDIIKTYQNDIYNWNIMNASMYNGILIVKGSAKYKIGSRILYKSNEEELEEGMEFYVRSVNHHFVLFDKWITILGVTRGLPPSKRFASPWGTAKEYSSVKWQKPNEGNPTRVRTPGLGNITTGNIMEKSNNVIEGAKSMIGTVTYTWGGKGPNDAINGPVPTKLDCSGFTQYVFKRWAGINIGVSTYDQINAGEEVSFEDKVPGDLILFKNTYAGRNPTHVGIYIGGNQFIHCGGHGVVIQTFNDWWSVRVMCMRRVLKSGYFTNTNGTNKGYFNCTFYTIGEGSGTGKTASGTVPVEGRTIAVDPKVIPLGSKVSVQFLDKEHEAYSHVYIAEDTGGAIKGNRLDIFIGSSLLKPNLTGLSNSDKTRALKLGRADAQVVIVR